MELLKKLLEQRAAILKRMTDLIGKAAEENRAAFTTDEQTQYDADLADVEALDARIKVLEDQEARERVAAAANERVQGGSDVRVLSEPQTYTAEGERRGTSFFRDLANQRQDPSASDRLRRHMEETADLVEQRDVGTGAFAGLTVPQYLTDMVAPLRRAGRPTADICNQHPLPPDGMTVNISRITTGSATAIQATENSGVQETDMDDTLLTVNVRTIAGMQDVSRQAIDRGTGIDEITMQDLVRAYNTTLDSQILNADGTSGTHLGIRSTSGIVAVTYTDGTPTAAELWPKLWDLTQQVQTGVFLGLSHFVMHPRRFWWEVSQVGTSFPFIQVYQGQTVQAGSVEGTGTYENGIAGRLGPVPVILDANLPTNLGGGTEDVILGVTNSELHLWEDPSAPLFIRTEEALANQLSVRFVLYGYSAFTAGRYPGAQGTITGTGLIAPTF